MAVEKGAQGQLGSAETIRQRRRGLTLETFIVFLFERFHVFGDVSTVDVGLKRVGIKFLGLGVVAGEATLRVGDEDSSIGSSLHGTEDTGSGRGAVKSNIKESLEGAGSLLVGLGELESAVGLGLSLVGVGEAELGEGTASDEESGSVGSGPVGETVVDAVAGELVRVGGGKDEVSLELGGDDL